jgi:hypothetical protein
MQDTLQVETPNEPQEERSRFHLALAISAAAVVVVAAVVYFLAFPSGPGGTPAKPHLPFGPDEQAYAGTIRIESLGLSRAANMLQQEITTLDGDIVNGGSRALSDVEITIEFSDALHQVVLRETRGVLSATAPHLVAGEKRSIEVAFEHIPPSWNMQVPLVRVSGLQFAAAKQ